MLSINKVILIGKVVEINEIKEFKNGGSVIAIRLLTVEKNKNNNIYNWHRIIFYNNLAKIVKKIINKSDLVFIEGKINNRKWIDKDKNTKYILEIISEKIKILIKNKEEEINNKIENLEYFDFEKNLNNQNNFNKKNDKNISDDIILEIEKFNENKENNEYFEYENDQNNENNENYENYEEDEEIYKKEIYKEKNYENINKNNNDINKYNNKENKKKEEYNNQLIDDSNYD
ncbi:Single-stranded DNA-binding protein [Candidatus Nasuia deltocephalinicola]|nr:Single-stranded DNA-binding protein [Candidatus Nasuia deltocephalinicola]